MSSVSNGSLTVDCCIAVSLEMWKPMYVTIAVMCLIN